jgi:hypothetical protein
MAESTGPGTRQARFGDRLDGKPRDPRSLKELVGELPAQISALVHAEVEQIKVELTRKAINGGIGIGFFVVVAVLLYFMLGVLVAAAVLGIAVALPAWLAALIVAAALLVIAGILALLGVRWFKKAGKPLDTPDSVKTDIYAVKGLGDYDR